MFSKKATKIDEIFTVDLTLYVVSVKWTVKSSSIFVAFLENTNFNYFNRSYALSSTGFLVITP